MVSIDSAVGLPGQIDVTAGGRPSGPGAAVDVATVWLPAGDEAVAVARAHVADVLTDWGVDSECVSDAVLLVSELATNVARHSQARSVGVDVGATERRIVVGVRESGTSDLPQPSTHVLTDFSSAAMPAPGELRGRGLKILDALAAEWGMSRAQLSTSTWYTLAPLVAPPLRAVSPSAASQLESVQASLRRTQLLLRITEHLGNAVTAEQVGEVITRHLRDHLEAMFTGIAVFTADRRLDQGGRGAEARTMRYLDLSVFPEATRAAFTRFAVDVDVPVAAAALTRTAFFHGDRTAAELEFAGLAAHMTTAGAGAIAHLPLIAGGQCLGTLALAWADPREIDADTRALLAIVAGYAAHALLRHITDSTGHALTSRTGAGNMGDGVAVVRAEQRLADARAEFDAALEHGSCLAGLMAVEAEIKRATDALAAARANATST